MNKYRIRWSETTYYSADVEAESEEEAWETDYYSFGEVSDSDGNGDSEIELIEGTEPGDDEEPPKITDWKSLILRGLPKINWKEKLNEGNENE